MVDFLNWELTNKLHELGYDGDIFLSIDTDGFISNNKFINPSDSKPAILKSATFRWFREKHGLQGYVYSTTVRGGKEDKHFSDYCWHINGIDMPFLSTDARDMENVSYEEAEVACLTKLIEILKTQIKIK